MKKLERSIGLYTAVTMGVGTMVGSGIFVLAGISFQQAGPSASLAMFLAGIAAVFTAFSFAELVTIIPTAGGGYAYVREATDDGLLSFITGWGLWLSYSMSCGLFALGFGDFVNYFFPFIPPMVGAYLLIIYVMSTNLKGIENSGKLQNFITTSLIGLLTIYVLYGVFNLDLSNQTPFFAEGYGGAVAVTGILYMTYIGYDLITTASEEIIDPKKNLPRAIFIALAIVLFFKTIIFFIASSILNWEYLTPAYTDTPITDTAVEMAGGIGGYMFALAGIFATLSSINTAMMASSRISFVLARDFKLPSIFKKINPTTKTPIFSVLFTALIVFVVTTTRNLEYISTITSILALGAYSMVNVALIIFRREKPDLEREFKAPFYPISPVLGIAINIALLLYLMVTDFIPFIITISIAVIGLVYYLFVLPKLKKAPKGITPKPVPHLQIENQDERIKECYKVLVPVAYPETTKKLLGIGLGIAKGHDGRVLPLHVVRVPEVVPIDSRYNNFKEEMSRYEELVDDINKIADNDKYIEETLSVLSRDINNSIKKTAIDTDADFVLLGWHKSGLAYRMLGGVTHKALEEIPKTVGIFKPGKKNEIERLLYPYGGGFHSQVAAKIVEKIAKSNNAKVTFFRVVEEDIAEDEYKQIEEVMSEGLSELEVEGDINIVSNPSKAEGILELAQGHDLVVLGASSEWGIKDHITGSETDKIMEELDCAGLVIRAYKPILQQKKMRRFTNKIKGMLSE